MACGWVHISVLGEATVDDKDDAVDRDRRLGDRRGDDHFPRARGRWIENAHLGTVAERGIHGEGKQGTPWPLCQRPVDEQGDCRLHLLLSGQEDQHVTVLLPNMYAPGGLDCMLEIVGHGRLTKVERDWVHATTLERDYRRSLRTGVPPPTRATRRGALTGLEEVFEGNSIHRGGGDDEP
eukprot:scaffold321746_cov32-Tisochrysis_lutea.AAC.2